MNNNERGITLIALIITIIVLLILAGISVTALTGDKSLINEARTNSQEAQKQSIIEKIQADLLQEKTKTGNTPTKKELKDIIKENGYCEGEPGEDSFVTKEGGYTVEYNEIAGWEKILADVANPGDYVEYIPDVVSADYVLKDLEQYSGTSNNTLSTLVQERDLKWRVLDIKDGMVRLISDGPTTSTIALYGAKGYNNGVYLIDEACKTLYNSSLAQGVQNLKIEDIQDKLTYDYTKHKNTYVTPNNYGGFSTSPYTVQVKYPKIYEQEKNNGIGGTKQTGVLDLSEQTSLVSEEYLTTDKLSVTQTYWYKALTTQDYIDNIYYELFMNKGGTNYKTYWISSRYVDAVEDNATFGINVITDNGGGSLGGRDVFDSAGNSILYTFAIRPVVTLNLNTVITGGTGAINDSYQIK